MADPFAIDPAVVRALYETHGCVGLLWAGVDGPLARVILRTGTEDLMEGPTMADALARAADVALPDAARAALPARARGEGR